MCGRFYVDETTAKELERIIRNVNLRMRNIHFGDIYPSQTAGILAGDVSGLDLKEMNWGFPQYQKKGLLINARAETVLERKMFRESVLHRRCVIPAKHFYEWDASKNKVSFSGKTARYCIWPDSITGLRKKRGLSSSQRRLMSP